MVNHKETAKQVVEKIGGKSNISHAWHCVTRLRFNLSDKNLVALEEIKKIQEVMGAQFSGDQFQVIIGNSVDNVFEEVQEIIGTDLNTGVPAKIEGIASNVFDAISGIFTPIVPALAGSGLLKGFLSLAVIFGWMSDTSQTYLLLFGLSNTVLYFFPFILAISSADKFKTNKYLALALAGAMMYPDFLNIASGAIAAKVEGTQLPDWQLFGILPVPLVNYSSSVIPIIFAVLLLKYINNWVRKWMPKVLNLMFTPMVTLVLVFPVTMVIIGPAGTYLGDIVGGGITWLFSVIGPVAGLILGAIFPLLVMTGMHYSLVPIGYANLGKYGYDNMFGPISAISNLAQSGATFAVALRSKNSNMKQIALSSGISASIGITEPAMYGVNMKLKKPIYAAFAGSGIASAFIIFMNVRSFGGAGMPGLLSVGAYISSEDKFNVIWFIVGMVASWILSFIFTLLIGFEDEVEVAMTENNNVSFEAEPKFSGEKHRVFSPMNGQLVNLKDVADETFSSELVGKGIAIEASDENVYSPVSGTIIMFPSSKHAIGLVSNEGLEVLIHIGINTVNLGGEGFNLDLKQDQKVEKGELLGTVDYDIIKENGLKTITMVIVTNTVNFFDVSAAQTDGVIFKGEEIIHVL